MKSTISKMKEETKALDYLSIGICILDSELKVLFWNSLLEELTGVSREEIVNAPITTFFPAFTDAFISEQVQNIFMGWPPVVFSSRLHNPIFHNKKDASKVLIQDIKVAAYPSGEETQRVVISVEDVTDIHEQLEYQKRLYHKAQEEIKLRKQAQEKLEESESKLKEMNKMKNQLFSIIGHDLRSPIASLMQFSGLFLDKDDDALKPDSTHFQLIYDLSKNSMDLLENLLDWAKMQMGGVIFHPHSISLEESVNHSFSYYMNTATIKKISLKNNIASDAKIYADENMLNTILRNLLGNAIKYTFEGGEIVCDYSREANYDTIKIIDRGVGMDEETRKKLFSESQQISEMGTNNEVGTGLGLVLCKKYVAQHNGEIEVKSKKGIGTTFLVKLPLKVSEENE